MPKKDDHFQICDNYKVTIINPSLEVYEYPLLNPTDLYASLTELKFTKLDQQGCGHMWSGSTHYALLSGIERIKERRGKKIRKNEGRKRLNLKKYVREEKELRPCIKQSLSAWEPAP